LTPKLTLSNGTDKEDTLDQTVEVLTGEIGGQEETKGARIPRVILARLEITIKIIIEITTEIIIDMVTIPQDGQTTRHVIDILPDHVTVHRLEVIEMETVHQGHIIGKAPHYRMTTKAILQEIVPLAPMCVNTTEDVVDRLPGMIHRAVAYQKEMMTENQQGIRRIMTTQH
jgi:hypothetical protein